MTQVRLNKTIERAANMIHMGGFSEDLREKAMQNAMEALAGKEASTQEVQEALKAELRKYAKDEDAKKLESLCLM